MLLSAPAALAVSVVLSALGAIVLCLLIALYGFTPASELSARRARRRRLIIGLGHAVAASCFAATAILVATVLVQPQRFASPAPRDDARVSALGTQLAGQASRLKEQESRLAGQDARLKDHDSRLKGHESRLAGQESRLAQAEARLKAAAAAPPRQPVRPQPARVVSPPERPPVPGVVVARPVPSPPAAAVRPPHDLEGSAFTPPPAPTPMAPAATSAPPAPPAMSPAVPAPPARRAPADPTPTAAEPTAPPTPPRSGLLGKLREDWATIKRSFEAGEEDFRRTLEETKRKLRGLVE